jgi:hypothetical protein
MTQEHNDSIGWEDFSCPDCYTRDDVVVEIVGELVFKHIRCCDYIMVEVA